MSQDNELRCALYSSARKEIITRIQLRDGALIAYILVIGAYMAFMLNIHFPNPPSPDAYPVFVNLLIMAPLPFLSYMFTNIIIQHHIVIGALGKYLAIEWESAAGSPIPQWDASSVLLESAKNVYNMRLRAQAIIIIIPLFYSTIYCGYVLFNFLFSSEYKFSGLSAGFASIVALIEIVAAVFICDQHLRGHKIRSKYNEDIKLFWKNKNYNK